MQLPLQDPSFSLSSPHFKEGQGSCLVTTRVGWEPSSPEAAPRCPQPWPAPSVTLLLGGPTLVTLGGCSPSSPHGTSPDRSLKSSASPQSTQAQGILPAAHGTRLKPPQILASRGISSPSTPGRKLLYHPLLVLIPSKHSWPMAPSPGVPLPQAPAQCWCQHSLASPATIFYLQTQSSSALQLLH